MEETTETPSMQMMKTSELLAERVSSYDMFIFRYQGTVEGHTFIQIIQICLEGGDENYLATHV